MCGVGTMSDSSLLILDDPSVSITSADRCFSCVQSLARVLGQCYSLESTLEYR